MIDVLESIQPLALRKRIKGEFYRMESLFANMYVIKEEGKINFVIEKTDKNNKNIIYKFIISNNYPYVPPVVYINDIKYWQYLRCPNKFLNILKYIRGIECFCCSSCTCHGNWYPSLNIKYIIDEIEDNRNTKYNIMIKIFLDKIKEQYLNSDIELDSWLFYVARPELIIPGTKYLIY